LHGRRAMSEGPLLFFTLLSLWLVLRERPSTVGAALALAAAIAAKATAVVVVPAVLLGVLLAPGGPRAAWQRCAPFVGALALGLWALHPSAWSAPLAGVQAMQAARAAFLAEQAAFVSSAAPHLLLGGPGLRLLATIYHLFFAPPAYADVGQYAAATAAAESAYAALPLNTGWHSGSLPINLV